MSDAAVYRVLEPGLSLVGDGDSSLGPIADREVHEELGGIAGSEDLVDGSKPSSSLLVAEVRGEDASPDTLPPQELACTAWGAKPGHIPLCLSRSALTL